VLILSHIGYTVAAADGLRRGVKTPPFDLRIVAFMALLPDIIDRTLYLFVFDNALSSRLIAHTLLFNLALLIALTAVNRRWWVYGAASMFHLVLDSVPPSIAWWHQVFWPFLGADLEYLRFATELSSTADVVTGGLVDRIVKIMGSYLNAPLWYLMLEPIALAVIVLYVMRWRRSRRPNVQLDRALSGSNAKE
jgi:hypothetical protein